MPEKNSGYLDSGVFVFNRDYSSSSRQPYHIFKTKLRNFAVNG
jgi:hypothetical protein